MTTPTTNARYIGDAAGWCPGHEPLIPIDRSTAETAARLGYWQSAGGWIYSPEGRRFVDWLDLADYLSGQYP